MHLVPGPPLSIHHFHLWNVLLFLSELILVQLAIAAYAHDLRPSQKPGSVMPWITQPQLAQILGFVSGTIVSAVSLFLLTLRNAAGFRLSCLPFSPYDVWFVTCFAILIDIWSRSRWLLQEYVNACFHLSVNLHLLCLCYLISGDKGWCLLFCVYEAPVQYVIRCSGPWSLLQDLLFYYTMTQTLQGGISEYCGSLPWVVAPGWILSSSKLVL